MMMRFPNPVVVACLSCGQPTVIAETSTGLVQVHCGTWRWQCHIPATGTLQTSLGTASGQELAA
jgi:hypothetical protein